MSIEAVAAALPLRQLCHLEDDDQMSVPLRQDKRVGQLTTPLGKDKLVLVGFECEEGVSEKFEIRVDALSEEKNINFDSAIGQNCTISVELEPGKKRYFDGILAEAGWIGSDDEGNQS